MNIWRMGTECPHPAYQEFKDALIQASYHFADDSTTEWGKGYRHVDAAVNIAIDNEYPFWAINRMFREIKSLVDIDMFMGKMLAKLYKMRSFQ